MYQQCLGELLLALAGMICKISRKKYFLVLSFSTSEYFFIFSFKVVFNVPLKLSSFSGATATAFI